MQKDGILQRTFAYRPPDLGSAMAHDFINLSLMFNNTIKRLGHGWAVFFEVQRFGTQDYASGNFASLAARLVDDERNAAFRESGSHYESSYYITFVKKPETEALKKLTSLFIKSGAGGANAYLSEDVKHFIDDSNAMVEILASTIPVAPLNNDQTIAYLHSQISFRRHNIAFPHNAIFLDRILPDEDLENDSLTLRLGERYIPIVGVNDFPMETYPAIFENLNQAELEYRWVTRYLCTDKEFGTKEAEKLEKAHPKGVYLRSALASPYQCLSSRILADEYTVIPALFYLNLNIGDVGHTLIFVPTGVGKSTLLNLLEMQFFKYPRSQVIVFDKGRSCRQPCMACGGLYYEPASDNLSSVNFQPLHDLERPRDITFAVEFIEALLTLQNVLVVPAMSKAIMDAVKNMRDVPHEMRTISTFSQQVNYVDPATRRNIIQENITPYLYSGAYGKIFDNNASKLSYHTRYLAIEMEHLMNLGEKAVIPALLYLFYFVEKMFHESKLTMLVLDEAWLFLKNPLFAAKIAEWLKTLRKQNVYVVFATQDVADAAASPIRSTLQQQCLTKIFLADPQASTAGMYDAYISFGLSDSEIGCISAARMKHDYFYKSTAGTRLFQLELGQLTLALIAGQNHERLDALQEAHKNDKADYAYCKEILESKNINYKEYV